MRVFEVNMKVCWHFPFPLVTTVPSTNMLYHYLKYLPAYVFITTQVSQATQSLEGVGGFQ